ncbi:MAG TPA: twin-arginine translocase subunit TatC [Vicinamibacterales bacterium]|jgi:sec-independent protein translocase protein TatC|nr:twin-arginine translocase subunit TatC [Vicinamibacterales bacterium]
MALVPFPSKGAKSVSERDPDDWDDDDAPEESGGKMSFLDHLDELRRRLMWALGSVVLGFGIACLFYQQLFNFVIDPMRAMLPAGQNLIYTEPTEALMLYVKIAVIAGILIASPGVMAQVWLFVAPGLYSHEKKLAIPFIALSSLFFIGGAAFAHYVVFPITFTFFASFSSDIITFMPRIEPAFALYMKLVLIFGLVFQMPTIVLLLARLGIITAGFLWRNFKYAVLIIFIIGAALSPGTDPVGQIVMAGPMVLLYLLSIGFAWAFGKKRQPADED